MTDQSRPEHVAVVCSPQGDDAAAMRDFLKTHNLADAEVRVLAW